MLRSIILVVGLVHLLLQFAACEPVLSKVAVLHRHGARGPLGFVDGAFVCDYPFCQLTDYGKEMCLSLGHELSVTLDYPQRLGFPQSYNVSFMHSESTDYARVVVSAEAVVMGIFEGQFPLPFVDFVPKTSDTRLVMWQSWPTWVIRATYAAELHVDDEYVIGLIGADNLTLIGSYFGIEEICATQPTDCVSFVQDYIACNVSAGLPVPTMFLDNWELYRIVMSRFLARMLGYFPDDDYSAQIGSLGQPYVQDVLSFFTTTATGPLSLMKLKHSAAHDMTLLAVYSTLGIWTEADVGNTRFVPRFAETLILELYTDSINASQYVRALWGYPNQAPPTFQFNLSVAPMKCQDEGGSVYNASGDYGCPIADLIRFVNASVPQASDGICYATHDMLKAQGCLDPDAPPAGSRCLFYRQNCPGETCGKTDGAIADPANGFACQTNQLNKGTSYYAATVIALVAPSLLAGAIVGFYGADKLRRFLWPDDKALLIQSPR